MPRRKKLKKKAPRDDAGLLHKKTAPSESRGKRKQPRDGRRAVFLKKQGGDMKKCSKARTANPEGGFRDCGITLALHVLSYTVNVSRMWRHSKRKLI